MAAYPSTPGFKTESVTPINSRNAKPTESGKVRGSSLAQDDVVRIVINHKLITTAERATLQTWYDTNKDADNTITARSVAYNMYVEQVYSDEEVSATYQNSTLRFFATRV